MSDDKAVEVNIADAQKWAAQHPKHGPHEPHGNAGSDIHCWHAICAMPGCLVYHLPSTVCCLCGQKR